MPSGTSVRAHPTQPQLNWTNLIFMIVAHACALAAIGYLIFVRASGWTIACNCATEKSRK